MAKEEKKRVKNRDVIDDYDKFRMFLNKIFYYCSLSNDDLQRNIAELKSSDTLSRYKYLSEKISEGKISNIKYNNKKVLKYDVTQFESDYNHLANSFYLKPIRASRACLSIYILFILSNNPMTKDQIIYNITENVEDKIITSRINELLECGLISKKEDKYFVEENRFYKIDKTLLLNLLNMIDMMKNLIYPEASGHCLFELLKKIYEERTNQEYNSPFQFKYSHLATILDNNILWKLIEAIEKRQYISFDYKGKRRKYILPIKIFTENEYDRQYLFAVYRKSSKIQIIKLSEIYDLKIYNMQVNISDEEYNKYLELYKNEKKYSFSGKIYAKKSQNLYNIELIYKSRKPELKNQILRDFGNVEFLKGNRAIVKIKEKNMIIPYLRANMGLITATDEELSRLLNSEIEEMKKIYGIV